MRDVTVRFLPVVEATVVSLALVAARPGPSRADRFCGGVTLHSKDFPQALRFDRLPGQSRPGIFLSGWCRGFVFACLLFLPFGVKPK